MNDGKLISTEYLEQAQSLVSEIKSGNSENASKALEVLIDAREKDIFYELGKLTREFHDALTTFRLDSKFADITKTNIPDARDRLNHVIKLTSDSADCTLTAVEKSIPICDELAKQAEELKDKWARFQRKEMCAEEFRVLSTSLSNYFTKTVDGTSSIKDDLNKVLMAQSFQDLTGQIIKQVITLVDDVETNLVNLVKTSSISAQSTNSDQGKKSTLDGPQIPGIKSKSTVVGQDEVDDLLSSLGF